MIDYNYQVQYLDRRTYQHFSIFLHYHVNYTSTASFAPLARRRNILHQWIPIHGMRYTLSHTTLSGITISQEKSELNSLAKQKHYFALNVCQTYLSIAVRPGSRRDGSSNGNVCVSRVYLHGVYMGLTITPCGCCNANKYTVLMKT